MTIVAILKHLSSKSANYGKALEYLIFQHDERNGRPLRDENGNRMLREEYYLDGMNCDPFSFDKECEMLNADYHKNQTRGEVKSHHYIISFDPKDVTECGLTGEKAQALGREFAERFFAGHQALICTHTDGHNNSGNIHVHIVINSLRKFDVDRQDFMERSNNSRAGFKHHQTRELPTAMQKGLMEITEREGLHQIDLLSPAPVKNTEREYRKTQREQRKPGGKNFQTKLQEIRDAVYAASSHAKNLEEFKDALLTDYGIALRISRGRFSYLHPEREKYISARKLGTDFDQAHLLSIFAENAKTRMQKPQAHKRSASGTGSIRKRPDGRREGRYTVGIDPKTGKQIRRSVYGKTQIADEIGAQDARVHDLRHTYAVLSLQNGDDVKTVQTNLGHASAAFTLDVYGHVSDRMQRASADRMEEYIASISRMKSA